MELRYVILLILGLIVLIAAVVIFRQHIMNFVDSISSIFGELNKTRPPIKEIVGG